jgi:hypothetical protein
MGPILRSATQSVMQTRNALPRQSVTLQKQRRSLLRIPQTGKEHDRDPVADQL